MRIAIFDFVASSILDHIAPDGVEVSLFKRPSDPVKTLRKERPLPDIVYVAQPPGATTGYAVLALLRDAFPEVRLVGVKVADAHKEGFLRVGADAVIDVAGFDNDIAKFQKQREKDAKKAAEAEAEAGG